MRPLIDLKNGACHRTFHCVMVIGMPTVVLTLPDVATTVIVELVEVVPEPTAPDPPHALSEARPITLTSTKNNSLERLRLFIPAKHSSAAKAETGNRE